MTTTPQSEDSYIHAGIQTILQDASEFYFEDLFLQVEDSVFKVPRRTFDNNSQVFRDMFLIPAGQGSDAEGSKVEKPIRLEGIEKCHFISLLNVLFPRHFGEVENLNCAQWMAVLRLATMWQLAGVRKLALESLRVVADPVTKIELFNDGRNQLANDLEGWLLPAVQALASRKQILTTEEGTRLGIEYTLLICNVREQHALKRPTVRKKEYDSLLMSIIQEVFGVSQADQWTQRTKPSDYLYYV